MTVRAIAVFVWVASSASAVRGQGESRATAAKPAAAKPAAALHATRELSRGAVLAPADIAADSTIGLDPAAIVGWTTRRVVRKGEPLREPAVGPPPIVNAGSMVSVRASVDGIAIAREGVALANAATGERVRVRLDARRTITGTAAGPAVVRIP